MRTDKPNVRTLLNLFDEAVEDRDKSICNDYYHDFGNLEKFIDLFLKQMKIVREVSKELRESLKDKSEEEFILESIKVLEKRLSSIHAKLNKFDSFQFHSDLIDLPDKKGRIFLECMVEMEDVGKLSMKDPTKRARIDKAIETFDGFKDYIMKLNQEHKKNREALFDKKRLDERILVLRIDIEGIRPPIWRRIFISNKCTFDDLHEIIQIAFGWMNYHLHQFEVDKIVLSRSDQAEESSFDYLPTEKVILGRIINTMGQTFRYTYDFGDCWDHKIVVQKITEIDKKQSYPCCTDGKRCGVPEDSGGVSGYQHIMKVRRNKNHHDYPEMIVGWLGENFDPEELSLELINKNISEIWNTRVEK